MEVDGTESSPMKVAVEEIDRLRGTFKETLNAYAARVDSELDEVRQAIAGLQEHPKVSGAKMRDLRDILTLLRNIQIKADKGRRKDIKKIDSVVVDLRMLIENW